MILSDLQRAVEAEGLMYPPDPTERSCFLGGNVATNASGARTFKYGPTRNYVERLKIALANGEVIDLRRGGYTRIKKAESLFPSPPAKRLQRSCRHIACLTCARTLPAITSRREWTPSISSLAAKERSV